MPHFVNMMRPRRVGAVDATMNREVSNGLADGCERLTGGLSLVQGNLLAGFLGESRSVRGGAYPTASRFQPVA